MKNTCLKHTCIHTSEQIKQNAERARELSLFLKTARIAGPGCDEGISFGLPARGPVVPTAGSHNSSALLFFSCFFFSFSPCLLFKGIEGWFRTGGGNHVKTAAFGHGIYVRLLRVCVCTCLRVFRKIFDSGTPSQRS